MTITIPSCTIKAVNFDEYSDSIIFIRTSVFVAEQNIPLDLEWDNEDENASHYLAFSNDNNVIAYARLFHSGKIGRVAVLKQWRRQGVGTLLLAYVIDHASKTNHQPLFLSAQISSIPFYLELGFEVCSETFLEAGIKHVNMNKTM